MDQDSYPVEEKWKHEHILCRLSPGFNADDIRTDFPHLFHGEVPAVIYLREIGEKDTIITRGRQGALILSSQQVAVLDFDFDEAQGASFSAVEYEQMVRDGVQALCNSYRLYKTAGGYRLILTDKLHSVSEFNFSLFETIGADKLYNCLCLRYNHFRARLTPKPFRLGLAPLCEIISTNIYLGNMHAAPFDVKCLYQDWVSTYTECIHRYSVCQLIAAKTPEDFVIPDEIQAFVALHDGFTLNSDTRLA